MVETKSDVKIERLFWAVLAKTPSGRSEVIKVADHDAVYQAIKENPAIHFKSGPFLVI